MQPENQNIITTDSLQQAPEVKLPEMPVDTAATDFVGSVMVENENAIQKMAQNAGTERKDTTTDIQQLMMDIGAVENNQTTIEDQLGASKLAGQIGDIQSQIDVEGRALSNTIKNLYANPNLTQNLVSRKANEAQRTSASYMADLAITQQVLSRNYDRAIATAQRKVDILTAPLRTKLEAKKFGFEANKDLWSTQEKAQIENVIRKEERAYNDEKQRLNDINELAITARTNGAPDKLVQNVLNAKTREEAILALGQYASDPVDRAIKNAQLSKIQSELSALNLDKDTELGAIDAVEKITNVQGLIDNKKVMSSLVAGTKLGTKRLFAKPFDTKDGSSPAENIASASERADYLSSISQLIDSVTLDQLATAKERGVTFGALSEGELNVVASAGTKLGNKAIRDKDGRIVGFKGSEEDFTKDLEAIQQMAERDYFKKTGQEYKPAEFTSEADYVDSLTTSNPFSIFAQ